MLKPNKKITKQELKEDKFVKFSLQAKNYVDENYQKLMRIGLGILAVVVIIIFFYYESVQTEVDANSQLGIAEIEFTNGQLSKASQRLSRLIEDYDGTDAADQGLFLLANIYFQQQNYDQAREYFEKFVDAYNGSNILLSSGYAGLAACEEADKNYMEAASLYEQAAETAPDFPEADNQLFLAGLCYKKAGDIDKAKSIFEELAEESEKSSRKKDAESQLVLLK
jgi:tetratricopeptide (TPR) repeat protein